MDNIHFEIFVLEQPSRRLALLHVVRNRYLRGYE